MAEWHQEPSESAEAPPACPETLWAWGPILGGEQQGHSGCPGSELRPWAHLSLGITSTTLLPRGSPCPWGPKCACPGLAQAHRPRRERAR